MHIYATLIIKEKEAMNMRRCGGGRRKGGNNNYIPIKIKIQSSEDPTLKVYFLLSTPLLPFTVLYCHWEEPLSLKVNLLSHLARTCAVCTNAAGIRGL